MNERSQQLELPTSGGESDLERQYRLERRLAERLRGASAEERRGLYSSVYDELFEAFPHLAGDAEDVVEARVAQVDLELRLLAPFLSPEVRFLEFGAGEGELARRAAPRVRRCLAVDASRRLRQTQGDPPNFERLVSDGSLADFEDGSVDLVYSCHFIEHLHPDDLAIHLCEAMRLLAPGGRYVCVTPNRLLGPHDVSRYFTNQATGLHLCEYSHRQLAAAFRRAGFGRVRVIRTVGRAPEWGLTVPYLLAEAAIGLLPRSLRLRLLSIRAEPFRPFEQVKLLAEVGGRGL